MRGSYEFDRYWSTPHGLHASQSYRRRTSLFVSAAVLPPSKRAMRSVKARAQEALRAAFASSRAYSSLYPRARWPKPRAAIALDISLHGELTGAPRVDTMCKWLLDELAGHVYRDDSQVKLLFAHADRRDPKAEAATFRSEPSQDTTSVADSADSVFDWELADEPHTSPAHDESKESAKQTSKLYVHARTRANVVAALKASAELPYAWDPIDDDDDYKFWNPHVGTSPGSRRSLAEYLEKLKASSVTDPQEIVRAGHQLEYHDQAWEQRITDVLFSSLFTFLPAQRYAGWEVLRDRLITAPYVFDLGVLPKIGGGREFKIRLRQLLTERRDQFPHLFPMRAKSGISMVLFEDGGPGKDLDNLIRTVLPDVLDVLRPPRTDLPGWVATEPDIESAYPDIPFIEVVAIPAKDADMPPGTVIFGLSGGHRYQSWWGKAEHDMERRLDQLIDRD